MKNAKFVIEQIGVLIIELLNHHCLTVLYRLISN